MAKRRRRLGEPDKLYGYVSPDTTPGRNPQVAKILMDGQGKVLARGRVNRCTKVKPHERGAWISSERCTYWFAIDGRFYSCRGRGDGVYASCRVMKKRPAHVNFNGGRRR